MLLISALKGPREMDLREFETSTWSMSQVTGQSGLHFVCVCLLVQAYIASMHATAGQFC